MQNQRTPKVKCKSYQGLTTTSTSGLVCLRSTSDTGAIAGATRPGPTGGVCSAEPALELEPTLEPLATLLRCSDLCRFFTLVPLGTFFIRFWRACGRRHRRGREGSADEKAMVRRLCQS